MSQLRQTELLLALEGQPRPAEKLIPFSKNIVLERGVRITKAGDGTWQYSADGSALAGSISEIVEKVGLKVVRCTLEEGAPSWAQRNPDRHFHFATSEGQPTIEHQIQELNTRAGVVEVRLAQHVNSLAYMAQAVTYHLGKLIDCYVGFLDWVAREHGSALQPSAAPRFGGEIAQYFEFEALITAVVRAYETARFPIWTAFGSETKCPRSFVETIERSNVPPPLNDCVAEALRSCMRAKQYRNCIQHHAHFGAVYQFSRIKQYNGLVWGAQTFIPDNPTAKSNDKFVYENRMDALSFGWALTSDLLRDLVDLVRGLPQR